MPKLLSLSHFSLPAQHLLSGLTAAIGVLLVALAAAALGGFYAAAAAAVGATCISIVDTPTPPDFKRRSFVIAVCFDSLITLGVDLCRDQPLLLGLIVIATSFTAAMVTVYGRIALAMCMSMILAMVLTLGTTLHGIDGAPAWHHAALFAAGAAGYALFGTLAAQILAARHKQIALREALAAFADYVRGKAGLYDTALEIEAAYGALIERQVTLMERVDAARNLLFRDLERPQERQYAAALVAMLDAFETILSSQTDYWLLRRHFGAMAEGPALLRAIRAGVNELADAVDLIAVGVDGRDGLDLEALRARFRTIAAQAGQIAPLHGQDETGHGEAALELRATLERIGLAIEATARLQTATRQFAVAETVLATVRLADFLPPRPYRPRLLLRHLRYRSPVFRYALRLSLAMLCAFILSEILSRYFSHGSWILLTVAVIMRASYSATRQRQKDRLIGSLIGCVLAAGLLHVLPDAALLAVAFVSIGLSHAYAPVRYRITSTSASVMALLMMHFLSPTADNLLLERLLDTLLGAGIAWLFSFVLPYWERQDVPDLSAALLRALRKYARQAMKPAPAEQNYRLARKDLFDAIADFAGALKRMPSEPGARDAGMPRLRAFLATSYRMMTQLAAVHVLLRMRGRDIAPHALEQIVGPRRQAILRHLGGAAADTAMPAPDLAADTAWPAAAALLQRLRQAESVSA
ncbi:FUSC family membrane protein, partial [Ferrovibrio sp.]|uniref:FUSC family protein n=1 Tax=Ferrovibrio sp. TaxID=1917215 RepID=UPI00261FE7E8